MIVTKETKNTSEKSKADHNSDSCNISDLVSQKSPKKSTNNISDCIDYNAWGEKSIIIEDRHIYDFEVIEEVYWIDVDCY